MKTKFAKFLVSFFSFFLLVGASQVNAQFLPGTGSFEQSASNCRQSTSANSYGTRSSSSYESSVTVIKEKSGLDPYVSVSQDKLPPVQPRRYRMAQGDGFLHVSSSDTYQDAYRVVGPDGTYLVVRTETSSYNSKSTFQPSWVNQPTQMTEDQKIARPGTIYGSVPPKGGFFSRVFGRRK